MIKKKCHTCNSSGVVGGGWVGREQLLVPSIRYLINLGKKKVSGAIHS